VLPVKRGPAKARPQVIGYMLLFVAVATALVVQSQLGYVGGGLLIALAVFWLYRALAAYQQESVVWGKQVFLTSLLVVMGMVVALSVGSALI